MDHGFSTCFTTKLHCDFSTCNRDQDPLHDCILLWLLKRSYFTSFGGFFTPLGSWSRRSFKQYARVIFFVLVKCLYGVGCFCGMLYDSFVTYVDGDYPVMNKHQKLGSAGLALHYANIITQIDTLVSNYLRCNFSVLNIFYVVPTHIHIVTYRCIYISE